jgi:ubiquinone/menaquinone biosynthesis C-methylase UbiE
MTGIQSEPRPGDEHVVDNQRVSLVGFAPQGRVLDIGGGGEGAIGRLLGEQVVAIDLLASELVEAPEGFLKIVMDARDLKFLDNSFDAATAFFSFMFMPPADHPRVIGEIRRVLKSGAMFTLWDVTIPARSDPAREFFSVRLRYALPNREFGTGYGVRWGERVQSAETLAALGRQAGFEPVEVEQMDQVFRIAMRNAKP